MIALGKTLSESFTRWRAQGMMREGAALAFYATFSMAPIFFLVSAIATSIFGLGNVESLVIGGIGRVVGPSSTEFLRALLLNTYRASADPVAAGLGLLAFLFGAASLMTNASRVFDVIFESEHLHSVGNTWGAFFKQQARAFFLVVLAGLLLSVFFAATVGIAVAGRFFEHVSGVPLWGSYLIGLILSFAIASLLLAFLYRYLPSRPLPFRNAVIGAVLTAVCLVVGEYALRWLFGEGLIGSYGAGGAVIGLLAWVYYSALFFLFGAEFSYVYFEREHGPGDMRPEMI